MKPPLPPATSVRIPKDIKDWVKKRARKTLRSASNEIVDILRRAKEEQQIQ